MAPRLCFRLGKHSVTRRRPQLASDRSLGISLRRVIDERIERTWTFDDEYTASEVLWILTQAFGRPGNNAPYDQPQPEWEWLPPGGGLVTVAFSGPPRVSETPGNIAVSKLSFSLVEILSPDT